MGMIRPRVIMVMLGLPGALVIACGGAVVTNDDSRSQTGDAPSSRPPRRPTSDASPRDVSVPDAPPGDCACTDEIVQVEGTCTYTTAPRIVDCVAEHSADAGYQRLDIWRSCLPVDAPPSWTPTAKPTELELCSCVPGEKHSLCIRYL